MLSEESWVHPFSETQGGRVGLYSEAVDKSTKPLERGQLGLGRCLSLDTGARP